MKDDELYTIYLIYLNRRLMESSISRGTFSLLCISRNTFDSFKYKYINNCKFSKSLNRDKKINDIIGDIN